MSAEATKRWRERHPERARISKRNSDAKRRAKDPIAARAESRSANEVYRNKHPEKVLGSQARYRIAHPDKIRERSRKQKTGWSPEDFNLAWLKQNGCCEICGREMLREGTTAKSVNADHDHKTGCTRGLLCHRCNVILGHYEYAKAHPGFEEYLAKYPSTCQRLEQPRVDHLRLVPRQT
jgi:hypothetical protein